MFLFFVLADLPSNRASFSLIYFIGAFIYLITLYILLYFIVIQNLFF